MSRFWSPVVASLSPYVPGEQPKQDGLLKLNTNENPYGPSPAVYAAATSVFVFTIVLVGLAGLLYRLVLRRGRPRK